jgi:hypothetical protein
MPTGIRGPAITHIAERNYTIAGVTQDSTGLPLPGCVVKLFNAATDTLVAQAVSSATGAYAFPVDKTQQYYEVSYKVGPPDVYGTTVNTLTGV